MTTKTPITKSPIDPNALCFATIMYRSRLVPGWIPTVGLIGVPLIFLSSTATLFGAWEQVSSAGLLMALPIATWELSVGVYMTCKGFKTPPVTENHTTTVPDGRPHLGRNRVHQFEPRRRTGTTGVAGQSTATRGSWIGTATLPTLTCERPERAA